MWDSGIADKAVEFQKRLAETNSAGYLDIVRDAMRQQLPHADIRAALVPLVGRAGADRLIQEAHDHDMDDAIEAVE